MAKVLSSDRSLETESLKVRIVQVVETDCRHEPIPFCSLHAGTIPKLKGLLVEVENPGQDRFPGNSSGRLNNFPQS